MTATKMESSAVAPSIAEITITPELWARKAHPPSMADEAAAMRRLADALQSDPSKTFQVCVEAALELCHADTCGISLRERTESGEDIFRWIALTGQLKDHLHGTTPRFFSPCGICVDTGAPLLMRRPELVYTYLDVGPPFHDVLLIPLTEKGSQLEGTIWVVAHNETRKFDSEDARIMQRIAIFTATALHLANMAQEARAEAAKNELRFRELDHRVKNILGMTSSLLRYQLRQTEEPVAREALEAASARVSAIGQVHQVASGAADGDLAEVVRSVCAEIVGQDPRFELKLEVEPVSVPAHKAAVMALIVNELVTNAVKHGLLDRKTGAIRVSLRRKDGNSAVFSIADDGIPLPANVEKNQKGFGLNLIARLADQLAGEFKVETEPKQFTVMFPISASLDQA